jgi:hypothetical protein
MAEGELNLANDLDSLCYRLLDEGVREGDAWGENHLGKTIEGKIFGIKSHLAPFFIDRDNLMALAREQTCCRLPAHAIPNHQHFHISFIIAA